MRVRDQADSARLSTVRRLIHPLCLFATPPP